MLYEIQDLNDDIYLRYGDLLEKAPNQEESRRILLNALNEVGDAIFPRLRQSLNVTAEPESQQYHMV